MDSKTSNQLTSKSSIPHQCIHRCDTFEQASILCREIQRAQDIFQEEKMIYTASDDENDDNYNDNSDE